MGLEMICLPDSKQNLHTAGRSEASVYYSSYYSSQLVHQPFQ